MIRRRAQSGDGKLGCILWGLLVAVGALIAWKVIPNKIAISELYDFMVEQAKWAASTSPETLEKRIVDQGVRLKLPIDPKKVEVQRLGDSIRMRVQFTIPLEFPGYTYNWDVDLQVDRQIYIF